MTVMLKGSLKHGLGRNDGSSDGSMLIQSPGNRTIDPQLGDESQPGAAKSFVELTRGQD